jgi:condensin-2 complex subunit H2
VYEEDEYGGGYDFGGEDDYDDDNNDMGNAGVNSLDDAFHNAADKHGECCTSRTKMISHLMHSNIFSSTKDAAEESNLGKTFEELCRAHIQAFAKGAEDFALNSELSDRVSKWQERLAPILEEEERRAEFDIHKYSEKILKESAQQGLGRLKRKSDGSSGASTSKVDFESIAQNCSQSDVCRLFLASLSLANSGNLKVEEGAPTYRFDLISSNVERPMETYRAPSWVVDGG